MGAKSRNANELIRIGERARLLEGRDGQSLPDIKFPHAPILLFGVGQLGAITIAHMRRIGLEPVGLVDNNMDRWGAVIDGISVVSPQDAIRDYGSTGRFIVTIYNGSSVRRQLLAAGCTYVSHFADLYFQHGNEFLPFGGLTIRSTILNAWSDVVAAADLWYDEESRIEYNSQVAWRLRLPESELPTHDPPEHCYFPPDLFTFGNNEFLLDCGAFDGDSLQRYFSVTPPNTRSRIVAFEPDPHSYSRLTRYAETLREKGVANIRTEPVAVAGHSGTIGFTALGSVRSGVLDGHTDTVPCVAIDDLELAPTFLKMDVEGFELQALRGAAQTLQRHRPVLAISLYHHAQDLWTIPRYLKALAPDYNLFLRRYAEDCWEQILYAVPASRLAKT